MKEKAKKSDFTSQYEALQQVVAWFEQGEVNIEEGIVKLEEGVKLVQALKTYLAEVEHKVKEIKNKL